MTRILYWNIEKFGINKIASQSAARQTGSTLTEAAASVERLDYILENLAIQTAVGALAPPEILVVVEVASSYDQRGSLAPWCGGGSLGAFELLFEIRQKTANPNWALIPPLQTGPREAVAVYFDATNLVFTGPWQWPGGQGPSFSPGAGTPRVAYNDGTYNHTLPAAAVPAGGRNAGISQRELAACVQFRYAANQPNALVPIDFGVQRAPYWVTFAELAPGLPPRAVQREISLFCVHSPASRNASFYLRRLGKIAEIVDPHPPLLPLPNEVRVIAGDFNVNLLTGAGARNGNYDRLVNAGFGLAIDVNATINGLNGGRGYYATHMKKRQTVRYWTTADTVRYYPGYGYIGGEVPGNPNAVGPYSIDNVLTRYGGGGNSGGPTANATILNGISGSPFREIQTPALAAPLLGTYSLPIYMDDANLLFLLPQPLPTNPAPPPPIPMPGAMPFPAPYNEASQYSIARHWAFKAWRNFTRVRSTSDHMAIVADI